MKAGIVLSMMLMPAFGQSEVRETPAKYAIYSILKRVLFCLIRGRMQECIQLP